MRSERAQVEPRRFVPREHARMHLAAPCWKAASVIRTRTDSEGEKRLPSETAAWMQGLSFRGFWTILEPASRPSQLVNHSACDMLHADTSPAWCKPCLCSIHLGWSRGFYSCNVGFLLQDKAYSIVYEYNARNLSSRGASKAHSRSVHNILSSYRF